MTRTWFFDLDGTLADTDADIRRSWKAALADIGLSCPEFDELFIAGPSIEEMARTLFPHIYTDEIGLRIRLGFGRHYDNDGFPETREYPGVLDVVRKIKAHGDKAFIATNKRFEGAKAMCDKFGWADAFDGLYTGDMHKDDPIGKLRKPQLLALIMREHNLTREECIMVGDTINDFEAAKANGIESIGVTWGYGTEEELSHATRIAHTAEEIMNYEL